jgi:hypothetical protein
LLKYKTLFSINFKDDGVEMYLQMRGVERKFIDRGFSTAQTSTHATNSCEKRTASFHFGPIQFPSIKE